MAGDDVAWGQPLHATHGDLDYWPNERKGNRVTVKGAAHVFRAAI